MIGAAAIGAALLADALALAALAALVSLAFAAGSPAAGFPLLMLLVLAGFFAPRLAGAWLEPRRATLAAAGTALALVLTAASLTAAGDLSGWTFGWLVNFYREPEATMEAGAPVLAAVLLFAGAWARGAARAEQDFDLEHHARTMLLPFAVVIASAVLGAGSARAGDLATLTAAFFAAAVVSLALAQLALGGATLGTLRSGGITAVLLAGVAAAAIVSFALFGIAMRFLGPVIGPPLGAAAERVLIIVLTPVAWLLTAIFERLFSGIDPLQGLERVLERPAAEQPAGSGGDQSLPEQVGLFGARTAALLLFTALVAGIVFAWTRARRRYAALREGAVRGDAAGSLREDVLGLLRGLRPGRRQAAPDPGASAAARLYFEVLDDAERRGHPRDPAQTPHEFAPVLHDTYRSDLADEITALFEEARYAGREPDPRTVAELADRWRQVRRGQARGGPSPRPGQ